MNVTMDDNVGPEFELSKNNFGLKNSRPTSESYKGKTAILMVFFQTITKKLQSFGSFHNMTLAVNSVVTCKQHLSLQLNALQGGRLQGVDGLGWVTPG